MDLLIGFGLFLFAVVWCMAGGHTLVWALLAGFLCFFVIGLRRGFGWRELLAMSGRGAKTALVVQRILLMIGLLTALWRAGGTISFFVYTGILLITPHSFILIAFLLPAVLSLAFGSSFGVAGTAGVILMAIARSGQADLAVTAGAILSGAYVGERLSPASSAAALTAAVAGADQRDFQRRMWRTSPLPLILSLLFYALLSLLCPIQSVDAGILSALARESRLTWPTVLPALVMLLLPWCHVSAFWSITASCGLSALVALLVQGIPLGELLKECVLGYAAQDPQLTGILSGGGILSMLSSLVIIFLSCAYSGLLTGTGMLEPYQRKVGQLADRIGLFPAQALLSLFCAALFCNQAVSIVMSAQVLQDQYRQRGLSPLDLAGAIGNSAVNMAGLVPWCIACSVPLASMGGSAAAVPLAVYLYLVPLCTLIACGRRPAGKTENNL